jgi:hypothetical protein
MTITEMFRTSIAPSSTQVWRPQPKVPTAQVLQAALHPVQHTIGSTYSMHDSLRMLINSYYKKSPIGQTDWALLAQQAHMAYKHTKLESVQSVYLQDNVMAALSLTKVLRLSARYANDKRLVDIETALTDGFQIIKSQTQSPAQRAVIMSLHLAELLSNPLDIEPSAIDQCLRPYMRSLLMLAIKRFSQDGARRLLGVLPIARENDEDTNVATSYENKSFAIDMAVKQGSISASVKSKLGYWSLLVENEQYIDLLELMTGEQINRKTTFFTLTDDAQISCRLLKVRYSDTAPQLALILPYDQLGDLVDLIRSVLPVEDYKKVIKTHKMRYGDI